MAGWLLFWLVLNMGSQPAPAGFIYKVKCASWTFYCGDGDDGDGGYWERYDDEQEEVVRYFRLWNGAKTMAENWVSQQLGDPLVHDRNNTYDRFRDGDSDDDDPDIDERRVWERPPEWKLGRLSHDDLCRERRPDWEHNTDPWSRSVRSLNFIPTAPGGSCVYRGAARDEFFVGDQVWIDPMDGPHELDGQTEYLAIASVALVPIDNELKDTEGVLENLRERAATVERNKQFLISSLQRSPPARSSKPAAAAARGRKRPRTSPEARR